MYRIDNASSVAVKPAYAGAGTPNQYFDNGTVWDHDFANHLQEELASIATIKGAALNKAVDTQCATALNGIKGIDSASAATGSTTSVDDRVVVGSVRGNADGTTSFVAASVANATYTVRTQGNAAVALGVYTLAANVNAAGASSSIIGSVGQVGGGSLVASGAGAAIYASEANSSNILTSGDYSAIMGSAANSAAVTVTGDYSAILSCVATTRATLVSGNQSAAIASKSTASGAMTISGDNSAAIASEWPVIAADLSAIIASGGSTISTGKFRSAMIGCDGGTVGHDNCVALGSTSPGASPANDCVYGGDSNANKWILYSSSGLAVIQSLQVKAMPALDPADGTNTIWNNGGVLTMGT